MLALVAALLVWQHPVLLRAFARPLVNAGKSSHPPEAVEYIWLRSDTGVAPAGDGALDAAAALWRANPKAKILLTQSISSRLVELGVLPSYPETVRRELEPRGVPPEAIRLVEAAEGGPALEVRAVLDYLASRMPPENSKNEVHVVVFGEQFAASAMQCEIDRALAESTLPVAIHRRGLRDRRFGAEDWWRSRSGVKACMYGYLGLFYTWTHPTQPKLEPRLRPGEFTDYYRQRYGSPDE